MDYTTDALLTKIKTYAAIPSGQPAFDDTRLLQMATDEMFTVLVPWIIKLNQEYFVTTKDYTLVSNSPEYQIPTRAVGNVVRNVTYLADSSGTDNGKQLNQYSPENIENIVDAGYYMRGSYLHLINYDNIVGQPMRVFYYRRPGELIPTTSCLTVTSVDSDTQLTVSGYTAEGLLDIIQKNPPFESLYDDVVNTGTTLTMPSTAGIVAGDYVCTAGESPVCQLPYEATQMLVQLVVIRVLESLGDTNGMNASMEKYKQLEMRMSEVLAPRSLGNRNKIMNFDSFA